MCNQICDTLRMDDDSGDECVECGAQYPDAARRHVVLATRTHIPPSSPTRGQVSAPRATRGVSYHSFNFGPTGGRGLASRSGKR